MVSLIDRFQLARYIRYQTSRSSGPGGQNVNKVNSKVTLRFDVAEAPLPEAMKSRLREKFVNKITESGELLITSDEHRDQGRNKDEVGVRLESILQSVFRAPKKRRAGKPSRAAKERRLTAKKVRAKTKSTRRYRGGED